MKIKLELKHRIMPGLIMSLSVQSPASFKTRITIIPNQAGLITGIIQMAIDSCAADGGGVVIFPAGSFLCGGIQLKSNVTLQLDKGSIIKGSDKYADYQNDCLLNTSPSPRDRIKYRMPASVVKKKNKTRTYK